MDRLKGGTDKVEFDSAAGKACQTAAAKCLLTPSGLFLPRGSTNRCSYHILIEAVSVHPVHLYVVIQFISADRVQLNDKRMTLYFNVPSLACAPLVNSVLMSIRHGYTSANKML